MANSYGRAARSGYGERSVVVLNPAGQQVFTATRAQWDAMRPEVHLDVLGYDRSDPDLYSPGFRVPTIPHPTVTTPGATGTPASPSPTRPMGRAPGAWSLSAPYLYQGEQQGGNIHFGGGGMGPSAGFGGATFRQDEEALYGYAGSAQERWNTALDILKKAYLLGRWHPTWDARAITDDEARAKFEAAVGRPPGSAVALHRRDGPAVWRAAA